MSSHPCFNVYLHRLDRAWETRHRGLGRLIRYADDLVIVCRYESQADRALAVLQEELDRLHLALAPAKTRIVNLKPRHGEGFDFLGFHLRWVADGRAGVWFLADGPPSEPSPPRDRIREHTALDRQPWPVDQVVDSLNRFLTGWRAYFRHGNSTAQFGALDHFVDERMMLFISKKHQRDGRWYGRRVLYNSPNRLGLVRLEGTVLAPRPNRWR